MASEPRVQAVPVAQPPPSYPPTAMAPPSYPPAAAATASPYGMAPPKQPVHATGSPGKPHVGKLSLLNTVLRVLQVIFSLIGFSIMASAHVDYFTEDSFGYVYKSTLNWTAAKAYKFCLSMLVIVFVWAFVLAILDALEAFRKMAFGGGLKPYIVAVGDLILAFLLFGAACAAATIDTDIIDGFPSSFKSKVRAATAFAFLTWFVLVPTMVINLALVASEFFSG